MLLVYRNASAESLILLGRLYVDLHLLEFVAPLLNKALAMVPDSVSANWAFADYFFEIGKGSQARQHYERTLQCGPDSVKRLAILMDHAKCLVAIGETEQAEQIYCDLMNERDWRIDAIVMLAGLRSHRNDSEIASNIREELFKPGLSSSEKSELHLALGRIEENSGQYETAFDLYLKSRSLLSVTFDSVKHRRTVDNIISFYPKEMFAESAIFGSKADLPVFVVGMPRSGTTLTEQIIAAHRDAAGVGEQIRMTWLERAFRAEYAGENAFERIGAAARRGELKARAIENLNVMKMMAPGAMRVVDKNPLNYMSAGYIHLCFPNAKIIHCRRHPADNFLSAFQNRISQSHSYSYDQKSYAACYMEQERIMSHWKACFPQNIFEMQYEEIVDAPETVSRALIAFLGLPWDENCLNFFENKATVVVMNAQNVRKPIYSRSVGRWKRYEKRLAPLFEALSTYGA